MHQPFEPNARIEKAPSQNGSRQRPPATARPPKPQSSPVVQDERRVAWSKAGDIVATRFGRIHPPEMGTVLLGLYALGFTSLRVIPEQNTLFQIPEVEVGARPTPFVMQYEEQRPILNEILKKMPVPRRIRIQHFATLGMAPLSIDMLERIGIPKLQQSPLTTFRAALEAAFNESLTRTLVGKTPTPTAAEGARVKGNIICAERLRAHVVAFSKSPHAREGVPINISETIGEPVKLTIGNDKGQEISLKDLHPLSSRHLLFREGCFVLKQLGDFLRNRYLNDGADRSLPHR